jgi:predicted dehydrogenase
MIGAAVVGYGYWGPNLVRNLATTPGIRLAAVCDLDRKRLAPVQAQYPSVAVTDDYDDILRDPTIDMVAIATPVSTHFVLAMKALMAGKHVFVEKPIASSSEDAERLVEEAAKRQLVLAVDHTFVHTGAVRKIKELVDTSLGQIYYYDSVRVNLGLFQHDVSVIWDLAVHDLSIMDHILPSVPVAVSATGMAHVAGEPENIAYLTLHYPNNLIAHIHVNWLAPVKVRRTLIGGSKKMIIYDDLEPSEKIKVYDKGITLGAPEQKTYQGMVGYRSGDMWSPHLDVSEALSSELKEFARCIETGGTPIADGHAGLRVVRVLEAATLSLAQRGRPVEFDNYRRVA